MDDREFETAAGSPPLLPVGWVVFYDETRRKPYYYHSSSKQSTWKRPSVDKENRSIVARTTPKQQVEGEWKRSYSPQHGRHFYYNRALGQSSWSAPHRRRAASSSSSTTSLSSSSPSSRRLVFSPDDDKEEEEEERERQRERALTARLELAQVVLHQSRVVLQDLLKTKTRLQEQKKKKEQEQQQPILSRNEAVEAVSRIWVMAMLFCLAQLALMKLF